MRAALIALLGAGLVLGLGVARGAPENDLKAFQDFYTERFPDTPFEDFANGLYSIDESRRGEWEQMEEFPPYEFDIDEGEELFHQPFANGKGYADCFPDYESGVRQNYPHWDPERGEVVTMELAINLCREQHDEKPLKYYRGPLAQISAYLAYLSRGNVIDVKVPARRSASARRLRGGQAALLLETRTAQLLLRLVFTSTPSAGSCGPELIGPALGQVSHFPVFRKAWREITTLHRSYAACSRQLRASSFGPQSREYRNLEFFHTYMSNGIPLNGPGSRH